MVGPYGYDGGTIGVWWLDHMGMMLGSYGYDGWIIWVWSRDHFCAFMHAKSQFSRWRLDHMGMMVGPYGYGGWIIWVWWLDHMGMVWWPGDHDAGIIWCACDDLVTMMLVSYGVFMMIWWPWCWYHMCMMFVPYVYDPPSNAKKKILLLHTFYIMFRSRFYFISVFFLAIAGNVFMCIDINITMVIFTTYLSTAWTITWHFTMT